MKIAHVAIRFPPAEGGGEQHVYNLAKEQVALGHEVAVITTNLMTELPRKTGRNLPREEEMDGIRVVRLKTYPTFLPIYGYGSIIRGLGAVIKDLKPDIVHTHGYGYQCSDKVAKLRKKNDWKLIMTSHGFIEGRGVFKGIKRFYNEFIGKKTVRNLDMAVALSQRDKKVFEGYGAKRTRVIPNGLDLRRFERLPDGTAFKDKYGIKHKVILNVSRLAPVKGQRLLIEAYERARGELNDWNVVIIGEDWGEKENLKNLIKKFNLLDSVFLIGHVGENELIEAYAAADIFVLPSFGEGLPTVMLEAMACQIPVIATDVGGVSEGLGDCGLLIKPNTTEVLEALKKLCKDEDLSRRIRECEKKRIHRFDWRIIAKEALEAYEEL